MRKINRLRGNLLAKNSYGNDFVSNVEENNHENIRKFVSDYHKWRSLKILYPEIKEFKNPPWYLNKVIESGDIRTFNIFLDSDPKIKNYSFEYFMHMCEKDCKQKYYSMLKYLDLLELPQNFLDKYILGFTLKNTDEDISFLKKDKKLNEPVQIDESFILRLLTDDSMSCEKKLKVFQNVDKNFRTKYEKFDLDPFNKSHFLCPDVLEHLFKKPEINSTINNRNENGETILFRAQIFRKLQNHLRNEEDTAYFKSMEVLKYHGAEISTDNEGNTPENEIVISKYSNLRYFYSMSGAIY
uniref:Uncharacterized protein n=1 Tax=Borely moumouvirus TaxID=2712067 RepID=A0A6G6ADP3_9VIRU